mgnify:CR=1 FL=1
MQTYGFGLLLLVLLMPLEAASQGQVEDTLYCAEGLVFQTWIYSYRWEQSGDGMLLLQNAGPGQSKSDLMVSPLLAIPSGYDSARVEFVMDYYGWANVQYPMDTAECLSEINICLNGTYVEPEPWSVHLLADGGQYLDMEALKDTICVTLPLLCDSSSVELQLDSEAAATYMMPGYPAGAYQRWMLVLVRVIGIVEGVPLESSTWASIKALNSGL